MIESKTYDPSGHSLEETDAVEETPIPDIAEPPTEELKIDQEDALDPHLTELQEPEVPEESKRAERQPEREKAETDSENATTHDQQKPPTRTRIQLDQLPQAAEQRLQSFHAFRDNYRQAAETRFGAPPTYSVLKHANNVTRMIGDFVRELRSKRETETLNTLNVSAEVVAREEFFEDQQLAELLALVKNREAASAFVWQELMAEVNCSHVLVLQGISAEQFHLLIRQMGDNPAVFLSDYRGENGGRIGYDLKPRANGTPPLIDPDHPYYSEESTFWGKVLHTDIPFLRNLHVARNHSTIYQLKDASDQDVLVLPIHVDPKNPSASLGDLYNKIAGKESLGRSAIDYHKPADLNNKRYLGTGLYPLGIKLFLQRLNEAQTNGLFANLQVVGEEKLNNQTTDTIFADDLIGIEMEEQMNANPTISMAI